MLTDKELEFKAEEVEKFLIINAPSITLKHDMINSAIDVHVQKIMSNRNKVPDSRLKNLFAIVTGMGRGKTRTLVEITRKINGGSSTNLCVAITFNHYWSEIIGIGKVINGLELDKKMIYAINIVARIISMTYQISFTSVEDLMLEGIRSLATISASTPADLIRSCIQYIVQKHRDNGHSIADFVLLVDEPVKISDRLDPGGLLDIHETLRNSLLSTQIDFDDGKPLNVELVMSALNIGPTGATKSSRLITALTTPESLDVGKIWEKWLPMYLPESAYRALEANELFKFRLKLLIATVAPIPRAVQYLVTELTTFFSSSNNSDGITSPEELKRMFDHTSVQIKENYKEIRIVPVFPEHMRAILFEEEILVDDNVMTMVENSFLTNALDIISNKARIVPRTSILSMQIYSQNKVSEYCRTIVATIDKLLSDYTRKSMPMNVLKLGDFLECAVSGLLRARLNVLGDIKSSEMSEIKLSQLLLLDDLRRIRGISENLTNKLLSTVSVRQRGIPLANVMLPSSYDDKTSFYNFFLGKNDFFIALNDAVIEKGGVIEFITNAKECFDGLLLLDSDLGPVLLAHEEKSRKVPRNDTKRPKSTKKRSPSTMADMPKEGKQANRVKFLAEKARRWSEENNVAVKKSSALEALIKDAYVFVYFETAHDSVSFEASDNDCVMQLGERDVKKMLSFFGDLYTFIRGSSPQSQALDKKT